MLTSRQSLDFPLCLTAKDRYIPSITQLAFVDLNSIRLSWAHLFDGPPKKNYVITMLPIILEDGVVTNPGPMYTTERNLTSTAVIQPTLFPPLWCQLCQGIRTYHQNPRMLAVI
jgi:hypothetical protein